MRSNRFLRKAKNVILTHIEDEDFNVSKLAEYMNLSRSQTLRKIKKASGYTPNEFIREVRLQKALQLLRNENLTISEISYRVGFNNPSYFIKCFHERFRYAPGEYRNEVLYKEPENQTVLRLSFMGVLVIVFVVFILIMVLWWYHLGI